MPQMRLSVGVGGAVSTLQMGQCVATEVVVETLVRALARLLTEAFCSRYASLQLWESDGIILWKPHRSTWRTWP